MSKEFDNMDDLFRSAFDGDVAEVPEFVKSNIDKKLGFTSKKTGWYWFSGFAALLILTGAVTLFMFSGADQSSPLQDNQAQHISTNDNTSTASSHDQNHSSQINTNSSLTDESGLGSVDRTSSSPSAVNRVTGNSTSNDNLTNNNTQQVQFNQSATSSNSNDAISSRNSANGSSDENNNGTSNVAGNSHTSSATVHDNSSFANTHRQTNSSSLNFTTKAPSRMPYGASFIRSSNFSLSNPGAFSALDLITPTRSTNYSSLKQPNAPLIESRETISPWFVTATTGLNYGQSNYTFPTASEEDLYNNATHTKPGFEANVDLKYRLKNSITFGVGAGVSQVSENYHFSKSVSQIDTQTVWLVTPIYDTVDTALIVDYDSTLTTQIDSNLVTLYDYNGTTKATYLQIPFSLGTQIIRNKVRIELYAQGRFNYLLNGSGAYLSNDVLTSFNNSSGQIFRKWYLDLVIGTSVHYKLLDHLYLTGTLRYKPAFGQMYTGLNFNRTVQSVHIGLGASWMF